MDFSISARRAAGYPITKGNVWTGVPLESAGSGAGFPLHASETGIPLHRDRSTGFAVGGKGFPIGAAARERDPESERAKLKTAAEGFEAIFIRQLLQTMRSTTTGGGIYGGGSTGEMYADMVESALADAMAKEGSFGIADAICRQMAVREAGAVSGGNVSAGKMSKAGDER